MFPCKNPPVGDFLLEQIRPYKTFLWGRHFTVTPAAMRAATAGPRRARARSGLLRILYIPGRRGNYLRFDH